MGLNKAMNKQLKQRMKINAKIFMSCIISIFSFTQCDVYGTNYNLYSRNLFNTIFKTM